MNKFTEKLYDVIGNVGYYQQFEVTETLYSGKTKFQQVDIFKNPHYKTVLALDGVIQTSERDEFFYHEMLAHCPLIANKKAESVLIIGGGDGGILREVLRHKTVKKAVMVEIDGDVVELCKKYMPSLNGGAYDDERASLLIQDGIEYVKTTNEKFDVIIVDSTDPIGVGEVLFTNEFYSHCNRILNEGGVVSTQSGVPFYQTDEMIDIKQRLKKSFDYVDFYIVPVPTYVGSYMVLSFASNTKDLYKLEDSAIQSKIELIKDSNKLQYINKDIFKSAFMLPNYIKNIAQES